VIRTRVTAALIVLGVVALTVLLVTLSSSVLVILMAVVFAEGIRPFVALLSRQRVPQPLSILAVYAALLAGLAALVLLLAAPIATQSAAFARNFPQYEQHLTHLLQSTAAPLHIDVNSFNQQIGSLLAGAKQALLGVGSTTVAVIVNFVLVLVIGFMWLVSSAGLKRFVIDLLPERHHVEADSVMDEIGARMGGYVRGAAVNGVVVGVATGLISLLLGLPAPALIGAFAAVIALVPVVGAVLGVVFPAAIALTISPSHALLVLAVMTALQVIDANAVVPAVMNRAAAMPPLATVVALVIGGAAAGVIGALLAVPVAAALQVLVVRVFVPALHRAQRRSESLVAEVSPRVSGADPASSSVETGTGAPVPRSAKHSRMR
jgi:predicted PurR-regulated permease PerM